MSKKQIILILLFILITALLKLFWLSLFMAMITLFHLFFLKKGFYKWLKKKKGFYYTCVFLLVFIGAISLRLFTFEIYSIPSGSMENSILTGDVVFAEKLSYGPRMPNSPYEIPWGNLLYFMYKKAFKDTTKTKWGYARLRGYQNVGHNDVFVFNLTNNERTVLIKRCVGLPGDTLQIIDRKVYINNHLASEPESLKFRYALFYDNYQKTKAILDSLGVQDFGFDFGQEDRPHFSMFIPNNISQEIEKGNPSDSLVAYIQKTDTTPKAYPWSKNLLWTLDNYGPILIPQKGVPISLDSSTYDLYHNILEKTEGVRITADNGKYFLNGKETKTYAFKNDYYWMMGDNRYNSEDSRFWGFLPEQNIIAKARFVIFSKGYSGVRWNRIIKRIR